MNVLRHTLLLLSHGGCISTLTYMYLLLIRVLASVGKGAEWARGLAQKSMALRIGQLQWVLPTKGEDLDFINECYLQRSYEKLAEFVPKDGWTCLDIGANIGACSLTWSLRNPSGRILCFEPHPATFARLEKNIRLNNLSAVPIQTAVGDTDKPLTFHLRSGHSMATRDELEASEPITVPCTTLAQIFNQYGLSSVDLCKIDVEGCELACLNGAKGVLTKIARIILEYHSPALRKAVCRELEPHFDIVRIDKADIGLIFARRKLSG